jgi:hypothetical protein
MKKRIGLIALVGVAVIFSAGLRGCWDFTKPTPWAAEGCSSARDTPAQQLVDAAADSEPHDEIDRFVACGEPVRYVFFKKS